ncbi:related to monooxigenase [Ramularia collo-cygni]|uniref:Related to monooxigenase n=1 Tax=Ramularia collo-cygni TaxID=112498 RepID=A0A2D3VQQ8_9PEZI|nr:related to monooxigenase [Ramularia collo-cygni]CZT25729.1 related to monooxigenase [Ramularia collo-cygni]
MNAATTPINDDDVGEEWIYPWPTNFHLSEHYIDDILSLKVCVIGAGLAGITAGVMLPAKVPGIELTILEKNGDVGGTWYENVYPGVRCDVPSTVYQASFSPNKNWSEQYAQGSEILEYWKSIARKFDVYSMLRLNTKVVASHWDPSRSQWRVETTNVTTGEEAVEYFHFLITAIGHFNEWKLPSYPGMSDFRGVIHHSSAWDPAFDARGKRIATIGNGASGIQVTTALQKIAGHIDHYARNPTWIAGSFNSALEDRKDEPMPFTPEERRAFENPAEYLKYRKGLEGSFFRGFDGQLKGSETSRNAKRKFLESMKRRLEDGDEELVAKLTPTFPPNCRRLTPGPGYLEALKAENVRLIQTPIERFTASGIVTTDGIHREVDAVIASTGANVDYAPPFPITANGLDLSKDWKPEGKFGFPYSYLGLCTPGFPNLAYILGPNPAGINGTVPHAVETQVTYMAKMLRKMSSQRIKSMTPSKAATDDFVEYCDAFFPRTNLSLNCSSWSNGGRAGNRIHGHWPGSGSHSTRAKAEPRWEDFEYEYERPENRFAYFGNGQTRMENDPESDMTPYLSENPDLRDLLEKWYL